MSGQPVLVVDFGTSTSSAALVAEGQVRLVKEPASGSWSWPSAVCLDGDLLLVGTPADRLKRVSPLAFRAEFKRDLGDDLPIPLGDRFFRPEALVTAMLAALRQQAERVAGGPLERAVLTVPASYTAVDPRWDLMIAAGERAGFADVELLAEPAAAAFAPVIGPAWEPDQVVLVYDFGGGTFDAAVVRVLGGGELEVLGHAALDDCGGRDVDALLHARATEWGGEQLVALLTGTGDPADPAAAQHIMMELRDLARAAKHQLTDAERARSYFLPLRRQIALQRAELVGLVEPLLDRTTRCCRDLLDRTDTALDEVAGVLLVGGSSLMPAVGEHLARSLGRPLRLVEDPSIAVVQGGARWVTRTGQDRVLAPAADDPDERPLRWQPPGGVARLVRWTVHPGEPFDAGAVLAVARLPDGALCRLAAGGPAVLARTHADPGDPVTAADWIATVSARPVAGPAGERQQVRLDGGVDRVVFLDGQLLAARGGDTVVVWDLATGAETVRLGLAGFGDLAADGGGRLLATAGADATVRTWDPAGRALLSAGHGAPCRAVAVSADAARIATVADDGTVLLWRTEDMQRLHELDHGGPAGRVAFSPDGRRLVTAGDVVRVWAAAIGEHLLTLAPGAPVCDVVFSAHGDRIATAGADGAARIWDSLTGDELDRLDHDAEVHAVAFAPGGQGLVTSSGQGKVRTWRPDGRHADTERSATVTTITFSPDGLLRAEGGDSGQIWITEVGSP